MNILKKLLIIALLLPIALYGSNLNHRTSQDCSVDSSGSDGYYIWLDIYEPGGPVYNWIDITGIGTEVEGLTDDNNVGPFPIGFDFPYYWYYVDHFWVNANGAISFSDATVYMPQGSTGWLIPSPNAPNDLLIPFGADLTFEGADSAECYYYTNNVDTFIVSYINVAAWDTIGPTGAHTFQLILTRQDSCIDFQYGKQEGQFYSCVAGIENVFGNIGLHIFSGAPDSGYAVKFILIDSAGVLEELEDSKAKAIDIRFTCHPNPFISSTTIHIKGAQAHMIKRAQTIQVFDISGCLIRSLVLCDHCPGTLVWDGRDEMGNDVRPGVYFIKMRDQIVAKVVKVS